MGVPWTSFGGPWGVVLDSLWEADAPNVTHTDVSALSVFRVFSIFVFFVVSFFRCFSFFRIHEHDCRVLLVF